MKKAMTREVQVYSPNETPTGEDFCRCFCKQFSNLKKVKSVNPNAPLVVLAHNYSRIGTDIDTALQDLPDLDARNVAIVVFHIMAKHAIPMTMPTKNLTEEKYCNYRCLVDFFYTPEDKIYSCPLNDEAERDLKNNFLKVVSTKGGDSTKKQRSQEDRVEPCHSNNQTGNHEKRVVPYRSNNQKAKILQIYDPSQTVAGERFRKQFCSQLGSYKLQIVESVDQVSNVLPLVVMVYNHSRIGTDIDTVVMDLQDLDYKQVAVVVYHIKGRHALPTIMPTKTLTDDKYTQYGCLVDFFSATDGRIHSFVLNDEAEIELKSFVKSVVKKKALYRRMCSCCCSSCCK